MALVLTVRDTSAPDDVPLLVTGDRQIIESLSRALTRKLGGGPSVSVLKGHSRKTEDKPDHNDSNE